MSEGRVTIRFVHRAILASTLAFALAEPALAQNNVAPRDYPPTYSSRKAPWYDPFRVFTSEPKATEARPTSIPTGSAQANYVEPKWRQGVLSPDKLTTSNNKLPAGPVITAPVGPVGTVPAWNWYGYGAPAGEKPGPIKPIVPSNIGSIPREPIKPFVVVAPPAMLTEEPKLQDVVGQRVADVNWKSAQSATLKPPTNDSTPVKSEEARASLRPPVPVDAKPAQTSTEYVTPLSRVSPPSADTKEITVVPAPGIVVPK